MAKAPANAGCGYAFTLMFFLVGLVLLGAAWTRADPRGDPKARWAMAGIGLVFAVAGGALTVAMRRGAKRQRERKELGEQFPGEPWKWRPEWNGGRIEAGGEGGAVAMFFFAVIWNGISVPATVAAWPKMMAGEKILVLVMLFPLFGLLILWWAVYKTLQARKFGRAVFVPNSLPGEIGGYLGGVIHVPARIALEEDARLELACIRRSSSGVGKDRTVNEAVLWETEVRLAKGKWNTGAGGTDIPVLLHIDAGCVPTEISDDNDNRVLWRLSAAAKVPGVDFATAFEVPVFATGHSAPEPTAGQSLLDEYRTDPLDTGGLADAGIRHETDAGGRGTWTFTTSHLRGMKWILGLIMAGLLVITFVLLTGRAHWIVAGVVLFFDGLVWLFAADLWMGELSVRIEAETVVVTKRGWPGGKEIRLRRSEVAAVRSERSMAVGTREFFRLVLVGAKGVDPRQPGIAEPFAAGKLRHQLRQVVKELGVADPAHAGGRGRAIIEQMAQTPKFEVAIARQVPGRATAEAVAATMLDEIQRT